MKGDRVLIDTSVWIDYFRGLTPRIADATDRLLDEAEVFVPKMVIAELIQGARSAKEIDVLEGFFEAFHIIDQAGETWVRAGRMAYDLKKKGVSVPLSDCYLAAIARENHCRVFTLNRHFKEIRSLAGIELIEA